MRSSCAKETLKQIAIADRTPENRIILRKWNFLSQPGF